MAVVTFDFPDPAPVGVTIFLTIYLFVILVLLIPAIVLLIVRRNHKMLVPRSIGTLIPMLLSQYAAAVVFSLSLIMGKPPFCPALDAFYLLIPVAGMHFNLNIPNLVFQDSLNSMKVELAVSGSITWVARVMRAFTLPFRFLYTLVIGIIVVGVYLIIHYVGNLPGDCNRDAQLTYTVMLLSILVILFYFLVKVSRVQDPYYLKLENNMGSVLLFPSMIISIIYPLAPQVFSPTFEYRWVIILMTTFSLSGNALFPLLLTFPSFLRWLQGLTGDLIATEDYKELDTKGTIFALSRGVDVFQAVLNHAELCEAFTQFTITQWCVENVLFYKAVDEFKGKFKTNPESARQLAHFIAREYITSGSALEVNLDFGVRRTVLREVEEDLTETTFDSAQHHIYTLMENDSFAQWQRTGDFKRALESVVDGRNSSKGSKGSAPQAGKARSHNTNSPNRTSQSQISSQIPMTSTDSEDLKMVQLEVIS